SGSHDLPYYIEHLAERIGTPSLVVCLDSGAGDYERLWCTTSLRGLVNGNLTVQITREGVHSGEASGIVPSTFRIARRLLTRLEDEDSGEIQPEWLYVEIPHERLEQAKAMAAVLGTRIWDHYPWQPGARPVTDNPVEMLLNRTWRPQLEITGAAEVKERLAELLTADPPYGATVRFESGEANDG